jgi:uncharacterized integral membrane protein
MATDSIETTKRIAPAATIAPGLRPGPKAGAAVAESSGARRSRHAHRTRLYAYALCMAALVVVLAALIVDNTRSVQVSWVYGSSNQSLVWIVLSGAILGWLLGLATSMLFHHRTRAPR